MIFSVSSEVFNKEKKIANNSINPPPWGQLFKGYINIQIENKECGGADYGLGFSSRLISIFQQILFERNNKAHIGFHEHHHYVGFEYLNQTQQLGVSVSDVFSSLFNHPTGFSISTDFRQTANKAYEFHSGLIFKAVQYYPALKLDKSFLTSCPFASQIFGIRD